MRRYRVPVILSTVGTLCGYLLLHPYTMLVYTLIHLHRENGLHFHWKDLPSRTLSAFDPMMLPMAVSFALFGGVIGLLAGILVDRKATADQDILAALAVIEEQGRKIDAVISALRDSTEIKVAGYTGDGAVKMIDISREIEERIERARVSAS